MTMSRKIYLNLTPPTEEDARSDTQRIHDALGEPVSFRLSVLRTLSSILPEADWNVTLTLGFNGHLWQVIRIEKGDTTNKHYGVAVDLGSTTICMQLINMNNGEVESFESTFNRQIAFGEDILTRVFYCKDRPDHLVEIHSETIESFKEVLDRFCRTKGLAYEDFSAMVVSGNTTMIHFFIGMDPFVVFASPYAPHSSEPDFYTGDELDIGIPGFVYCVPCKANYLGGDILSGMVATGLAEREEISVFLDIGTNGELVVGNSHFLLAGAGAAGPALEGGVVKTGMRADAGAVSGVAMENGKLILEVIGNTKPIGICGSGIVDLISVLFLNRVIDRMGNFVEGKLPLVHNGEDTGIHYADDLVFWHSDILAFITTKAAANTMVEYILENAGIPMDHVDRFYVSGAFGTHIRKESAVNIGLYPDMERERIINAGNTSLIGAQKILMRKEYIADIHRYLENMEYIQFGAVADFVTRMTGARAIPHTDFSRYPSVLEKFKSSQ